MKNRIHISMAAVATALLLFSACEGDRDPVVDLPSSTGVEISNYDNINVGFVLYNSTYTIPVKGCSVIGIPAGEYSMFATTTHDGVEIATDGTMSMKSEKKEIILSTGTETWNVVPTPSAFSMVTIDSKVNVAEGATASVQVPDLKLMTRTLSLTFKIEGIDKDKVDKCEIYLSGVLRKQNYPGTFLDQSLSTNGDGTTYSMTGSKSLGENDTEFKLSFPLLGLDSKATTSLITTKIYIKDVAEPIKVGLPAAALADFNKGTSEVSLSNTFTVTETSGNYTATGGTWE